MDKFVGEAEKRVRELFAPAEAEYAAAGDASELHVIVFDEIDAIARTRGALPKMFIDAAAGRAPRRRSRRAPWRRGGASAWSRATARRG